MLAQVGVLFEPPQAESKAYIHGISVEGVEGLRCDMHNWAVSLGCNDTVL